MLPRGLDQVAKGRHPIWTAELHRSRGRCPGASTALNRGAEDLPFVEYQEGVAFQLLQVDIEAGLGVIRLRAEPGVTIQRHKHTGEVFAFTNAGSWRYLEYPEVNRAGSYLFEPAGAIHILHVPDSNEGITDVWFAVRGANLNLADDDSVENVVDTQAVLDIYLAQYEAGGLERPDVIGA